MRNALVAGALEVGRRAWQAGQNVEDAIRAAGFAQDIASYVSQLTNEPLEGEMSSKRARPYSQEGMTFSTSKVPKPVRRYVKKTIDRLQDDKYNAIQISDSAVATTGVVATGPLTSIVQGTTDSTRIGNHIRVKHITMKGSCSDTVPNMMRVIVAWDRQPNGALPAWTDICSNASVHSIYNHDNVVGCGGQRFTILYDRRVVINPNDTSLNDYNLVGYHNKKQNKVVTYDASTSSITDMVTNNLVVAYIAHANTADFLAFVEVCFVDA